MTRKSNHLHSPFLQKYVFTGQEIVLYSTGGTKNNEQCPDDKMKKLTGNNLSLHKTPTLPWTFITAHQRPPILTHLVDQII
jgi:hypothetical protein